MNTEYEYTHMVSVPYPEHVTEKECLCTADVQLLASVHVVYWESSHVTCWRCVWHHQIKLLPSYKNNTETLKISTPPSLCHTNFLHICQLIFLKFCNPSITTTNIIFFFLWRISWYYQIKFILNIMTDKCISDEQTLAKRHITQLFNVRGRDQY